MNRRYYIRGCTLLAVGLIFLVGLRANGNGLISGHYVFRTTYAPVCLNGIYPMTVGSALTDSTLTVSTDAAGQLSGLMDLRGAKSLITGNISLQNDAVAHAVLIQVQTTGSNPVGVSADLYAYLHGRQFLGSAQDQGGSVEFTMDVSSAGLLLVTFDLDLTVNGQGQVTGNGTASNCALQTPVTVTGTNGTACTLHIVGTNLPQFVWDGSGPPTAFGFVASWNAQGYGFTPTGAQLPIFAPNAPALTPYVVSRKDHLAPYNHIPWFITCDINLPTSGSSGTECRSGGTLGVHQLVISFPKNITLNPPNGTPAVRVSSGIGSVSQFALSNNEVVVNLTGMADAQTIAVTLSHVSDGTNTADVIVPARFLLGDTTGNGSVNASDISQTKARSGQAVDYSNFRSDVNLNGTINASDISLVKSKSGSALP
jgi:hypothetical protein